MITFRDYAILVLTAAILANGIIFYFWYMELRGCESSCREYYQINKTLSGVDFVGTSDPITLAYEVPIPPENTTISEILSCARGSYNLSEWLDCRECCPSWT